MIRKHLYTEFAECIRDSKPVWVEIDGDWIEAKPTNLKWNTDKPFYVLYLDSNGIRVLKIVDNFKTNGPKEELVPYSICRVRDNDGNRWQHVIYRYFNIESPYPYIDVDYTGWKQCEQIKNPIVKLSPKQIEAIEAN